MINLDSGTILTQQNNAVLAWTGRKLFKLSCDYTSLISKAPVVTRVTEATRTYTLSNTLDAPHNTDSPEAQRRTPANVQVFLGSTKPIAFRADSNHSFCMDCVIERSCDAAAAHSEEAFLTLQRWRSGDAAVIAYRDDDDLISFLIHAVQSTPLVDGYALEAERDETGHPVTRKVFIAAHPRCTANHKPAPGPRSLDDLCHESMGLIRHSRRLTEFPSQEILIQAHATSFHPDSTPRPDFRRDLLIGFGVDRDPELAKLKAFAESLERRACTTPVKGRAISSSARNLKGRTLSIDDVAMYVSGQGLSGSTEPDPDAIRDWVQGVSVLTNEPVYVPVEMVYFEGSQTKHHLKATTSGVALHSSQQKAIESAALELIERDSFLVSWISQTPPVLLEDCAERFDFQGREWAIDLYALPSVVKIPVRMGVARPLDRGDGTVVGLSCSCDASTARMHALREARVGLYGYTVDVGKAEKGLSATSRHRTYHAHGKEIAQWLEGSHSPTETCIEHRLTCPISALVAANFEPILVDLGSDELRLFDLHCMRVIVPGLIPIQFGRPLPLGLPRVVTSISNLGSDELARRSFHPMS